MPPRSFSKENEESSTGLVDQTMATLRSRILEGRYGCDGELPPQAELCEELKVSRGVVREAMQRLHSQRLIDLGQGRKPRVLPASADGLADSLQMLMDRSESTWLHLVEIRQTLEVDIAGRAAQHATAKVIRELEKSIALMQGTDDLSSQVESDMSFHRILAEATGNPMYVYLLDALASLLKASRERTIGKVGVGPALRGHAEILEAIRRGDSEGARAAMAEHLSDSWRDLHVG